MTLDLDKLAALAGAAREYEPPWDLVTMDLAPAARDYVRALSPDVVLALIERVRAAELSRDQQERFKWAANERADAAEHLLREREARAAQDARDDEAAARWTAARIDGGPG